MVTRCTSWTYVAAVLLLTGVSTAPAKYSGGRGEPNDPYQIATAADLIALGETPEDYNKHFILTADIDLDPNLPGRKVFDRAVIAPDTDPNTEFDFEGTPFTGLFDGNGHTILHLTMNGGNYPGLGLFGGLELGSQVIDLGVIEVNITSSGGYVGGLAGFNGHFYGGQAGGTITGCYSTGVVSGRGSVGGLVGGNSGTVTNSYSTGSVSGNSIVGGLVGYNGRWDSPAYSTVIQCYSTGSVKGEDRVGGLVGHNCGSISTSHSHASVSGNSTVGGLVGSNHDVDVGGGRVTHCYSTGSVSGEWDVGGLVGFKGMGGMRGSIVSSFWDAESSGQGGYPGEGGKTTAEMQEIETFLSAGWDFVGETANGAEDIWKIAEGVGYPRLAWEKYSGGTGEPNDPYQIATAPDLIALGETPGDYDKHFILTADIDLDPNLLDRKVFDKAVIAPDTDPARSGFQGTAFTGVFDGSGHTISHLTIDGMDYIGLFGQMLSDAEVRDIGLIEAKMVGSGVVGGLVGFNGNNWDAWLNDWPAGGIVRGCCTTGVVNGYWDVGGLVGRSYGNIVGSYSSAKVDGSPEFSGSVGGLVGQNYGGIDASYNCGSVTGTQYVGGLAGVNCQGAVTRCYSTGAVTGSLFVGGLVGDNGVPESHSRGNIVGCYSTGSVSGHDYVGGLVGTNSYGSIATSYSSGSVTGAYNVGGLVGYNVAGVTQCYSTGVVSGQQSTAGLVGESWNVWGTVTACFWDTETSGQTESTAGTGKTTAEMQTASTFLDAGWDFAGETANGTEDIWKIAEGLDYPRLWWEAAEE